MRGEGERGLFLYKLTKMYISNLAKCSIIKRASFFNRVLVDGMMGLFFFFFFYNLPFNFIRISMPSFFLSTYQ